MIIADKVFGRLSTLLIATSLVLSGCGGGGTTASTGSGLPNTGTDSDGGSYYAVIGAVAADYSSSEISIAGASAPYSLVEGYAGQDLSDISVATHGEYFYRIGRYNQDNLTKFSFSNPGVVQWQFSTDDSGSSTSSNPYQVLFASDSKAYVLRYGESTIWIIDPSVGASEEDNFLIGEIDLSAYDSDGVPEMAAGVIHNGRLYVAMQAMDASFVPGNAYLAVIDIATDTEIDTETNALKGYALNVKNPVDVDVMGNYIYVTGAGKYSGYSTPPEYTGGIEKISLVDDSQLVIVDDGTSTFHPYGQISELTLVSETKGYFLGYEGAYSVSLYHFNPASGAVEGAAVAGFESKDLTTSALSPEGMLWVGIGGVSPEIKVVDPSDNSIAETISIRKNPKVIVFSDKIVD